MVPHRAIIAIQCEWIKDAQRIHHPKALLCFDWYLHMEVCYHGRGPAISNLILQTYFAITSLTPFGIYITSSLPRFIVVVAIILLCRHRLLLLFSLLLCLPNPPLCHSISSTINLLYHILACCPLLGWTINEHLISAYSDHILESLLLLLPRPPLIAGNGWCRWQITTHTPSTWNTFPCIDIAFWWHTLNLSSSIYLSTYLSIQQTDWLTNYS